MSGSVTEHSKSALFTFMNFKLSTINLLRFTPCIYALLPSKRKHKYKNLAKGLSAITKNTEPHRILLDFEHAALNSFASHHTGTLLKGRYFHLCQTVNRKIKELGLKRQHEIKYDFNLSLRPIPDLSFVLVELVNAAST